MRDFVSQMQAAKDAAAYRRHRGEMTGTAAKGWIRKTLPTDHGEYDQFDQYLIRMLAMIQETNESMRNSFRRMREAELGGCAVSEEIPF